MPTRVYIPTEPYTPTGEAIGAPAPAENMLTAPAEQGVLSRAANRLLGTQFGEERYQTWPEKMVRSAATLAGDVVSGAVPVLPPGSRREDFTDAPEPGVPDNAPWWKMAPVAAQPNDLMMERAQDLAGVAMGGGIGGTGRAVAAGEAVLGSGPVRQAAAAAPKDAPAWYSAVEHALEQTSMGSAPGAQWQATLRNARGVKPEEMAWLGLDDMLVEAQLAGRKVTRAEIQDHIKSHQVELRDVHKSDPANVTKRAQEELDKVALEVYGEPYDHLSNSSANGVRRILNERTGQDLAPTKYHDYQLPGGENYREHLITMPSKNINDRVRAFAEKEGINDISEAYSKYEERYGSKLTGDNYKSSHWDEPNILAHVRTNDRVIDGKKSLHLEEVQSDWHQQGRDKGYKGEGKAAAKKIQELLAEAKTLSPSDPRYKEIYAELPRLSSQATDTQRVPDAPFKKSWHELALKRMLRRAAEEGYERLSWTPGEAQAARYDLSKQVDTLAYQKNGDKYQLVGNKDGRSVFSKTVSEGELADTVGKDVAKRIVDDQGKEKLGHAMRYLEGLDLKVGGEGMRGFYDDILPKALQKIGREHGVKVQRGGVETKPITKTVDDRYSVTGNRNIYNTIEEARKAASEPIFYIDIPQSLRDAAMRKGFPLFSGGKMFVPHQEEDK